MNAQKFIDLYKEKEMKFWKKEGRVTKIKLFQLINFLTLILGICKVRIYKTTYLAVKTNNIVELVGIEEVSQKVINYVKSNFPHDYCVINRTDILDALIEKSITFYNDKILNHLTIYNIPLLIDTKSTSEIAFDNDIIKINKSGHLLISYDDYKNPLLKKQIIGRNFIEVKQKCQGGFSKLVWNLSNHSVKGFKVLCSILGYLMHRYKDPANPKMIILIDQVIAELETSMGGSGKSLLISALSHIRNLVEVSGKKFQSNQRFAFQRVDIWTDIVLVNDASKNENLENWYNILADGFMMERKYEKEQFIPYDYSFKLAMTTNHMIKQPEGNSSERRKHEVEVSDYYGKDLTPEQDFGHILFNDWNASEWNQFDNFMVFCLEYYLQFGLITPPIINILKRKLISEVGVALIECMDEKIQSGVTKFHKKDTYDEFIKGGYVDRKYIPQRNSFTRKLKKYFEYKELNHTETPSDSKKYFELITNDKIKEFTTKSLKDCDVKYTLVDTDKKLKQFENQLKTH